MIRFLPILIIILLIGGGLFYWRVNNNKSAVIENSAQQQDNTPLEVPKTVPSMSTEDKVKNLEDLVSKLVAQVNNIKLPTTQTQDSRVSTLEASVTELKARVSALEKVTPLPTTSSQSVVYIPLGSGGGPWGNQDWYTLNEYEISLDPANYPNYKGMSLEVNFRLTESIGTASVRLYNTTDNTSYSEVNTTSTDYSLKSSSSFKIATGAKTYKLQMKSSEGKNVYIQSARLKVTF